MKEIRPSKTLTHGIKPHPTTERPPAPPSQNISNEYDEIISIALWAIRRLGHEQHKAFAYDELDAVTGKKWERV